MRTRTRGRWAVVVFVLATLVLGTAQAEDETGSTPDLEARLYRVGALTAGNTDFVPHCFPLVSPDMVSDEENPLFGAESEEPRLPFGTVDRLVELIQAGVSPAFWEAVDRAEIIPIHGESLLLVYATPAVHAATGRFLADLERRALSTVTIDLQAVRLPRSTGRGRLLLDDAERAAVLAAGEAGPAIRFTALPGQRAVAFDGAETAYLQDCDVEVSQVLDMLDPIVSILSVGLSAAVRAMPSDGGERITLAVRARLTEPLPMRTLSDERGWRYDLAAIRSCYAQSVVTVPAGDWALLDGQVGGGDPSSWAFLIRGTVSPPATEGRGGSLGVLRADPEEADAAMETRLLDVDDLLILRPHRLAFPPDLVPSNFTPPEPPEMPPPMGVLTPDALVEILTYAAAPGAWEADEATLEVVRWQHLLVRNTSSVVEAVARQVRALRLALLGTLVTTLEVVEMPSDYAGRLTAGPCVLGAEARRKLDEAVAAGVAHRIDGARVLSDSGIRNNVTFGTTASYLQDYEAEIGNVGADIKNPLPNPVVQTLFSGLVLDVQATPTSDLSSAHVALRIDRTRVQEPMRVLHTPHGGLDLPTLHLLRIRSGLSVPIGRTVVAGAARHADRTVLLLLTVGRADPATVAADPDRR